MVAEQTRKCGRQRFFLVSGLARILVINSILFMLVTFLGCCGCLLDFFRLPCGNQKFYIRAGTSSSADGNLPWFNVRREKLANRRYDTLQLI